MSFLPSPDHLPPAVVMKLRLLILMNWDRFSQPTVTHLTCQVTAQDTQLEIVICLEFCCCLHCH